MEKRNIVTCILLTLLTCGIYGLYWLYKMAEDFRTLDPDMPSGGMLILLDLVTCGIYGWYWFYKAGSILDERKGGSNAIIGLVLGIFGLGLVTYCIYQDGLNKLIDAE